MISVIVAALAVWVLGAGWYMAFSKPWLAHSGVARDAAGKPRCYGPTWLPFVISFIGLLLVAGMMRHAFQMGGGHGLTKGLTSGLGLGAFIAAPCVMVNHAYPGRNPVLWVIDGGCVGLGCGLIGAILGTI